MDRMGEDGKNVSVVLCGRRDIRKITGPIPTPDRGEVTVAVKRCGLCGTDLHLFRQGAAEGAPSITPDTPFHIGHECSGVVHSVGPGVTHLKPGDHVAVELGVPCSKCRLCREGKSNLCKTWSQGGLNKYLAHPAHFCHKLPPTLSLDVGALVEPLSVATRACHRGGVALGSHVVICGAGAIGLCSVLCAKFMGAASVCITDLHNNRLRMAARMGADCVVPVSSTDDGDSIARSISRSYGRMSDVTIDCCGVSASVQAAFKVTKSGGTVVPVAFGVQEVAVTTSDLVTRELDMKGVFSYCGNNYPAAISMVTSGRIDPTMMITNRYKMDDIGEAIALLENQPDDVIKVMMELD